MLSEEFLFKFFVFTCIYLNVISPHGTEHPPRYSRYPPRYSWYPPRYWTPPTVLHTHYTGWFCEGMFRLEESQMFSFEIHTGWKILQIIWDLYRVENLTKSKEIVRYFPFLKSFSFFVGGYLEYRGGCSVPWGISWCTWGDIMSTVGYWTPPTVLHTHYTGWKSYKIQGDCQVFSIFKKLFIFRDRCSPIYKFEWNIWWTRTTVKLKYLPWSGNTIHIHLKAEIVIALSG